ncbi:SDR family oxidoreductase [Arachidicoccus sp.]|uniref:SDR family oxidoreductase n=1 Tax=Arachidicoccus sp. TaxID=1872624 RepID=UPI003D1AE05A
MKPKPISHPISEPGKKLAGKIAIITGGDSGIGKAIALLFAEHGANIVVVYLREHKDAHKTEQEILERGVQTLFLSGDIAKENFCKKVIEQTILKFGKINILINNAAVQYPQKNPEDISKDQLIRTFSTNVFSAFYMTAAALPYMKKGSCIINTTSVTAYRGSKSLIDYSSTKGALVAFTRSLSTALIEREIRVNGVAPGPIWTPLIPSSFSEDKIKTFGTDVPMKRAGQTQEVAPCYLFLASDDSSYMTGQVLHPNGGEIING